MIQFSQRYSVCSILPGVFSLAILISFSGCSFFAQERSVEVAAEGSLVSQEQEHHFGRAVAAHIVQSYPLIESKNQVFYLNTVGTYLANFSSRPTTFTGYHFALFKSETPLAFSAPGGFIFISTGLVQKLSNEDELAAVLAHEIGHVAEKHGVEALLLHSELEKNDKNVPISCNQAFTLTAIIFQESVGKYVDILYENGFSAEQEYQADQLAVMTLQSAGYDPGALESVLKKLESSKAEEGILSWRKTHPNISERLEKLGATKAVDGAAPAIAARQHRFDRWKQEVLG